MKAWGTLKQYGLITFSCALYALGFCWCCVPGHMTVGGLTGIAQILNVYFPALPVGVMTLVMNIPLFILGLKLLGKGVLISSLYAMAVSSLMIDGMTALAGPFRPMEPLLACIYGGVLMGASLGVVFLQGATTGGTDLIARLLKLRLAWLPMGKLLMVIDLVVIVAVAVAFGNLNSALYGLVALYISTLVMDMVLYGLDNAKVAYIISDRHREISDAIIRDIDRGVTILHGEGAYSGAEKKVLLVAFKQRQIVAIKRLVKELDPDAFFIVCDASEVLGEGFGEYDPQGL